MKVPGTVIDVPVMARIGAILDRYLAVERIELLQGRDHDALWVANHGGPMGGGALGSMVLKRSGQRYGVRFSLHRFRHSLTTTHAHVGGAHALDAATLLGHGPEVSLQAYNRAGNIEAAHAHDRLIDRMEDEAERLLPSRRRHDADGHQLRPAAWSGRSERIAPRTRRPLPPATPFVDPNVGAPPAVANGAKDKGRRP
jgi:hypothetical protein